jgi:hypothetical protein
MFWRRPTPDQHVWAEIGSIGHTTVPLWTLTCLKSAGSAFNGSKMGPVISLATARSMTEPSVSVSRSFHPSSAIAWRILSSAISDS